MVFREEIQLTLGACEESLANEAAAADGNLGLDHVIAGAIGIHGRIEKHKNAHFLVAVQYEEPDQREYGHKGDESLLYQGHIKAADIKHAEGNSAENQTGTQIRLDKNQKGRQRHEPRHRKKALPGAVPLLIIGQKPGQADNHNNFCKFRRLQGERPYLDPPLSPQGAGTCKFNHQQHHRIHHIKGRHEAVQFPVVKIEGSSRHGQAQKEEHPLLDDEIKLSRMARHIGMGGAGNDEKGYHRQPQYSHEEAAVNPPPVTNQIHSLSSPPPPLIGAAGRVPGKTGPFSSLISIIFAFCFFLILPV